MKTQTSAIIAYDLVPFFFLEGGDLVAGIESQLLINMLRLQSIFTRKVPYGLYFPEPPPAGCPVGKGVLIC